MNEPRFSDQFLNKRLIKLNTLSIVDQPDTHIVELGYFPQARYHYYKRDQGADEHILILCSHGEGVVEIKRKSIVLTAKTYIIIPKGVPHIYYANNQYPWSIYWFHFNDSNAYEAESKQLQTLKYNAIVSAFQNIINLDYLHAHHFHYLNTAYAFIIDTLMFEMNNKVINKHVGFAIQYMKSNISQDISLDDIANFSDVSTSQLSLLFRKNLQCSPFSYYLRMKMEHASHLILTTNLHIWQIAQEMGIKDQFYFSRLFKRFMGVSPMQFRRHNR